VKQTARILIPEVKI